MVAGRCQTQKRIESHRIGRPRISNRVRHHDLVVGHGRGLVARSDWFCINGVGNRTLAESEKHAKSSNRLIFDRIGRILIAASGERGL